MDFLSLLSFFTDTPKEKIGVYCMHLPQATERLPVIQDLEEKLKVKITLEDAVYGKDMVAKGHPIHGIKGSIGNGAVGCTCSHVKICRKALEEGKDYAVIFEDDCVFTKSFDQFAGMMSGIKSFFKTYCIKPDIFILGALGYPSHFPNSIGICQVYDFHGSHALLLNKKTMCEYIKRYTDSLQINTVECADGYYNRLLADGFIGIGFTNAKEFFDQKQEGMWSYVGDLTK